MYFNCFWQMFTVGSPDLLADAESILFTVTGCVRSPFSSERDDRISYNRVSSAPIARY